MEITDFTLLLARSGVLILMYLFLLVLVLALLADARAANRPQQAIGTAVAEPAAPVAMPVRTVRAPAMTSTANTLQVVSGTTPTTGRDYHLFSPMEIGRGNTCSICIPNRIVSTHHARIFTQHGIWYIEDLGSTNGTLVNDQPLQDPHPLTPGDRLLIGDTEIEVR